MKSSIICTKLQFSEPLHPVDASIVSFGGQTFISVFDNSKVLVTDTETSTMVMLCMVRVTLMSNS